MMFSINAVRCVLLLSLSLSGNAQSIRGVQRELTSPTTVNLQTAGNYAILAGTGITTVPSSSITGDIAVSAPLAAMTGFSFDIDSTGVGSSLQIVGGGQAYGTGGTVDVAVSDMVTAYTDAAGRPTTDDNTSLTTGENAATPLLAGVYTLNSNTVIDKDIYFSGTAADIFIIQITGTLNLSAGIEVHLAGGALAENIFWQVTGAVTLLANSKMKGVILANASVAFGDSSSLNGRVLAQTACTLIATTIVSA